MPIEIKMPQLSDTMDSGKILAWNKNVGDVIERGDILAEVETDKANLEIESFHMGTLLKIVTPADQTANVGDIIAYLGEAGETISDSNGQQAEEKTEPQADLVMEEEAAVSAEPEVDNSQAESIEIDFEEEEIIAEEPQIEDIIQQAVVQSDQPGQADRVKASPLAKKIAQQNNIDLNQVQGSGPNGRIIKQDLESVNDTTQTPQTTETVNNEEVALSATSAVTSSPVIKQEPAQPVASTPTQPAPPQAVATPAPTQATSSPAIQPGTTKELSKMRATIAKRMQESVVEAPHFYSTVSINMGEAKKLRATLKPKPEYKGIGLNHFITKAVALALKEEPRVNQAMRDNLIYQPAEINVGIITAIEDGLLIPVIRNADQLSLKEIVSESRAAIERAREGKPNSTDLVGGTFSISNMGMFDIEQFTAIINPGQGAVLAVSSIKETPIVDENQQIVIGQVMKVTLSVDHRIIDGIMAASFLKQFKKCLEIPALLLA